MLRTGPRAVSICERWKTPSLKRIAGVEAHQDALLGVRFAVPICIAGKPEIRRLHYEEAIFVKLKPRRTI
jgi:hypothetical protein